MSEVLYELTLFSIDSKVRTIVMFLKDKDYFPYINGQLNNRIINEIGTYSGNHYLSIYDMSLYRLPIDENVGVSCGILDRVVNLKILA